MTPRDQSRHHRHQLITDVRLHTPHARIVRFKNGRPNLRATLHSLLPNQALLIRHPNPTEAQTLVRYAAVNARVRIRFSHHPALNTFVVTSLGPHRKRDPRRNRIASVDPLLRLPHGPRFQGWRNAIDTPGAIPPKPAESTPTAVVDIFS